MSDFKKAFAAARKAGKKEFTWNGKRYNTELKETVRPKPRNVASTTSPKPRPTPTKVKTGGVSPSIPKGKMESIREGNQAQRVARREARANRDLARDVRSTLKATAPKGNRDPKSREAVKKAMGGKFR